MRVSQLFTKTKKEAPADEQAKNAKLLIRAGYIYKVMAGVYAYTPLGLRVLDNIKQIVREEMNAIGGQELIMTSLQRSDTWESTGRWDDNVVDVWFKTKLKDDTEVGLAWSHEEIIVEMMKQYIESYKDLPVGVYQFQTKLRNELRAKSGIMRGREFVMKDMYSCSTDETQHNIFYDQTIESYKRVFDRLGIGADTHVTLASGGAFTKFSHEFQTICDAGEDIIIQTTDGVWHNLEIMESKIAKPNEKEEPKDYREEERPGVTGVGDLIKAFNIPIEKSTKTMIYTTDTGEHIFVAVRSDYSINELKLINIVSCKYLSLADPKTIKDLTGADVGYAGLVNLPANAKVYIDDSIEGLCNFETGANKTNFHAINVNFGRDLPLPEKFVDVKEAKEGDLELETGKPLVFAKAAEVGNIFNFGTQKSKDMDFAFTNEAGVRQLVHLGSYGIGITRVMGVIAEKLGDEKGLVWPDNIAPFKVYLVRLGEDEAVIKAADALYEDLQANDISVLYDDRDARAGDKFADADLLGMPYRAVVSNKTLKESKIEVKKRIEDNGELITTEEFKKVLQVSGA